VLSIALAKRYPFITVYALEPDSHNYASLLQNIARNGVSNVIPLNVAISGEGGQRTLYTSARESSWATTDPHMIDPHRVLRSAVVDTITLEELFEKFDIPHCRLLKMTALGVTCTALESFTRKGSVDLICGEVDLRECSKAKLEMISWQIARQHFWRILETPAQGGGHSWIQQLPRRGEFYAPVPAGECLVEASSY
jgi:FkbM family methyltransferase